MQEWTSINWLLGWDKSDVEEEEEDGAGKPLDFDKVCVYPDPEATTATARKAVTIMATVFGLAEWSSAVMGGFS